MTTGNEARDISGGRWPDKVRASLALDYALHEELGPHRDVAGRVRAAQIGALSRFSRVIMLANITNAIVLMASFAHTRRAGLAVLWTFALIFYSLVIYLRGRAHRGRPPARYVSCRGIRKAFVNALVIGTLWGVVPVLFFTGAPAEKLIVACLASGMMCAGCFVLAPIPVAALAYVVPIAIGSGIALLREGNPAYLFIALLVVIYVIVLLAASAAHAAQLIGRVEAQAEAERVALLDPLTQLPNRTAFLAALDGAVDRCARFGESFALLSIDLDGFKAVNDQLGHPSGDLLLAHVAKRLSSALRPRDMLGRVGGDEFAMLVRDMQTAGEVADIAERLLDLVDGIDIGGEEVKTGLSIGIVRSPSDGFAASTLLERADVALYEAKRNGRNGFRLFQSDDDVAIQRRRKWTQDLREAVARKELHLVFQPIMDLHCDRICGFEALLRWKHPTLGIIPPAEFIPVAEDRGLIREIGDFVIDEACRIASRWPEEWHVAVNVSLDQFRSFAIVATVKDALARYALPPERFEIEVTESILFEDEPIVVQALQAFDQANVRLVLDDFGTGYSSLRNLQDLPVHGVKIDRAFAGKLPDDPRATAIARAVIDLCRALDMRVTAEGVETPEQVATLRAFGCDKAQGFWVGHPLEEQAVQALCAVKTQGGRIVA